MSVTVVPGVIVERVGDDLMVIVPGNSDVVTLSGRPAKVLLEVKAGVKVDPSDLALRNLVDLGIVSTPGLSRRGLVKAGAIGAGAGIAVLAMPGVAAASSRPEPTPDETIDEEPTVQRTQLVGAFIRSDANNYFYLANYNSWILDEVSVIEYLDDAGVTTDLALLPDSLDSGDLTDITDLEVPGFNLTATLAPNPTETYIEWLADSTVDFTDFDFAVVGYFSWAGEDFEVYFFNP
jgi:hypothetical protein